MTPSFPYGSLGLERISDVLPKIRSYEGGRSIRTFSKSYGKCGLIFRDSIIAIFDRSCIVLQPVTFAAKRTLQSWTDSTLGRLCTSLDPACERGEIPLAYPAALD
jgi:hypothetical protein